MHWNPDGPQMPDFFAVRTNLAFECRTSPELLTDFFIQGLNLMLPTCFEKTFWKTLTFFFAVESWWNWTACSCCLSWDASIIKLIIFNSTCFIFLWRCQSIALTWGEEIVSKYQKFFLHATFWIMINQKWQKCYQYKGPKYCGKLLIWILLSSSESTVLCFQMTLRTDIFWFGTLDWNVNSPNMLKCPTNILYSSIFKLKFLWSHRLNFFRQRAHRSLFFKFVFFWNDFLYVVSIFYAAHRQKIYQHGSASCCFLRWRIVRKNDFSIVKEEKLQW